MRKNYEPIICPVCGNFYFSDLQEGDAVEDLYCHRCGWKYDIKQAEKPTLKDGKNEKCVLELRKEYLEKLESNPDYDYLEVTYSATEHKCPICGKYTFEDTASFDICPYCGWEDDELMEKEPDKWAGSANDLCLNDYKKRYDELVARKPNYTYSKDKYLH